MNIKGKTVNKQELIGNKNVNKKVSCQNHILVVNNVSRAPYSGKGLVGRSTIKKFSPSSGARMRKYLRCTTADYRYFITLTYPHNYERDGRKSKEHLRRFIQEYKRQCTRQGANMRLWGCFWFMEFQQRGAIHYHLFCTDDVNKHWLSSMWYEICGTEDKRHLAAGTNIEKFKSGKHGTCAYASKYAAKLDQKEVPGDIKNCGRFWGVSGLRICVSADTIVRPEDMERRSVKRTMNELRVEITRQKEKGNLRIMVKNEDVFVAYMTTMGAQMAILRCVRRLEYAMALYSSVPLLAMPEYETAVSFSLFEDIDYDISML